MSVYVEKLSSGIRTSNLVIKIIVRWCEDGDILLLPFFAFVFSVFQYSYILIVVQCSRLSWLSSVLGALKCSLSYHKDDAD